MPNVFSVPIFLVTFREALETAIVVSVLLAFLKQTVAHDRPLHKTLVRQVYIGTVLGLLLTLVIAAILIALFYTLGANKWESSELRYEGAFSLVACLIISVVGAKLLRMGSVKESWRGRLTEERANQVVGVGVENENENEDGERKKGGGKRAVKRWVKRVKEWVRGGEYAMFVLPFVTVLREGVEAVVFIAGVTFSAPASAVPLAVVGGAAAGVVVGWMLYKGGSWAKIRVFLVASTCVLYLVAAGLFSRAVWAFEQQVWQDAIGSDAAELGDGPGSYDIDKSVWHVNCCSPYINGGSGWGFFNAIFGWTNSATYGSVLSYNLYWLCVIVVFLAMRYHEVHGCWPLVGRKRVVQTSHEARC